VAFSIDPDRSVTKNARRLAGRQLDHALAGLADPDERGLRETVHDVRKRCKRARAVLRLVRPGLGGSYDVVNAQTRDAARALSPLRDAGALLGTFEALVAATHSDRLPDEPFERVGRMLADYAAAAERGDVALWLGTAAEHLQGARERVVAWRMDDDPAILLSGMAETHRRGRRAFRRCLSRPSDAAFHEWRKQAKYGWHHRELMEPLARSALVPEAATLKRLADALGDDHDLAILRGSILGRRGLGTAEEDVVAVIDAVRADLQDRCLRLGARLYAESPAALARRGRRYWPAWRTLGRERPVGAIEDLASEPADRPPHADDLLAPARAA
jgi:CHAD domain-containing protein